jgi:hypothetical protein
MLTIKVIVRSFRQGDAERNLSIVYDNGKLR